MRPISYNATIKPLPRGQGTVHFPRTRTTMQMKRWWTRKKCFAAIFVLLLLGAGWMWGPIRNRPAPPAFVQPATQTVPVVSVDQATSPEMAPFADLLELRDGEHVLAPLVRVAEKSLAVIDAEIQDYSATLIKRERVGGKLLDPQKIHVKIRHQPFRRLSVFSRAFCGTRVLVRGR